MRKNQSPFTRRKRSCPFTEKGMGNVDYKDVETLKQFVTERGKIIPRRISGVSASAQKKLKVAIKRARHMALIPFLAED